MCEDKELLLAANESTHLILLKKLVELCNFFSI